MDKALFFFFCGRTRELGRQELIEMPARYGGHNVFLPLGWQRLIIPMQAGYLDILQLASSKFHEKLYLHKLSREQ